jgi:hypothetical protein
MSDVKVWRQTDSIRITVGDDEQELLLWHSQASALCAQLLALGLGPKQCDHDCLECELEEP